MKNEKSYLVKPEHSAKIVGSGGMEVLSTPMLTAYLENCCFDYCQAQCAEGMTTVGSEINVQHLAPTKIKDTVIVKIVTVKKVERYFQFELEAYDSTKKIASATHTRVVVNEAKFMSRL